MFGGSHQRDARIPRGSQKERGLQTGNAKVGNEAVKTGQFSLVLGVSAFVPTVGNVNGPDLFKTQELPVIDTRKFPTENGADRT